MLRATALRKLVKPQSCPIPIALLGTEIGTPQSFGGTVSIREGTVTAVGDGYEFVDGILWVQTPTICNVPNVTTFTMAVEGSLPSMELLSLTAKPRYILGRDIYFGDTIFAAYKDSSSWWAVNGAPIPTAANHTLIIMITDEVVRVWHNGVSIARAVLYPDYMGPESQWLLRIGVFGGFVTPFTGKVNSVKWEVGALYPDVDNI